MDNENVTNTNTNGYLTTERMNTYHSQWCEQKLKEHVESNKPDTERKVFHKVTQRRNEKWLVTKSRVQWKFTEALTHGRVRNRDRQNWWLSTRLDHLMVARRPGFWLQLDWYQITDTSVYLKMTLNVFSGKKGCLKRQICLS